MIAMSEQIPEWLVGGLASPVAILGGGVSGKAVKDLIEGYGGSSILYDEKDRPGTAGRFDRDAARRSDLVVFSPGFYPEHPWLSIARSENCRALSELDLGAALWRGPIISVTGTNGKTTLTSFLNEAFRHVGIESYAVGNIGKPLCQLLSRDCNREAIAVCEVSSFQAETARRFRSDHVLWTNFDEDHLDRHGSMQKYFRSKYSLVANARSDSLFIDRSVFDFGAKIGLDFPEDCVVPFEDGIESLGLRGTVFETVPELNAYLMARSLWRALKLAESDLVDAARSFKKGPHRIEKVCEARGLCFWDDSKATNFHAVMGGLNRFESEVVWIGGGKSKGANLQSFVSELAPKIKVALLIGETRFELKRLIESEGRRAYACDSMDEAISLACEMSAAGDNVVLSPGFASFDMFENYVQRGLAFRKAIDCTANQKSI